MDLVWSLNSIRQSFYSPNKYYELQNIDNVLWHVNSGNGSSLCEEGVIQIKGEKTDSSKFRQVTGKYKNKHR